MISLSFIGLGACAWSVSEYLIHRFVGHGAKRTPPTGGLLGRSSPRGLAYEFNREHLLHHTDPTYFAPTARKLRAAVVSIPALTGLLAPLLGLRRAGAFGIGFALSYGTYEVIHRRIHTHPPRGRYGRWVRRHHLAHHYRTPRANHGVVTPLWDFVGNTHLAMDRIRVPRRTAPAWFFAATGALRPELARDYVLVGKEDVTTPPQTQEPLRIRSHSGAVSPVSASKRNTGPQAK